MFCNDGYNRKTTLVDNNLVIHVVYRPATRRERDSFRGIVTLVGERAAHIAICKWLSEHIVLSDIELLTEHPAWLGIQKLGVDHEKAFYRLWNAVNGLIPDAGGRTWAEQELEHQRNLREGILLEVTNPKLARRSCDDCQRDWYNEATGDPILVNSTGLPMAREGLTACRTRIGCLKGTPERQKALSKMNRQCFRHYRECAASSFPDDPLVKLNAEIIKSALESIKK